MRRSILLLVGLGVLEVSLPAVRGGETPEKYRPAVKKGLAWLVKQQKANGSWSAEGKNVTISSAFAGLALLMEGSTASKGPYADNLNRSADWFVANCQRGAMDGMLGKPSEVGESGRYMFSHGYGMLYLASACVRVEVREGSKDLKDRLERARRKELQDVLKRAVKFSVKAQCSRGGWFYTSCADGHDQDEGTASLCQIQALRAAQLTGVDVPREALKKALAYLAKNTSPRGGLVYSSRSESERPILTTAAIACAYRPDEYNNDLVKKWLKFAEPTINQRFGAYETYNLFHGALVMHALGDKGYAKLFGEAKRGMQWSDFRTSCFDDLVRSQQADGSWSPARDDPGAIFTTAVYLIVLQLDKEAVPIFSANKTP